jgi:S1-C subfamily serine protease
MSRILRTLAVLLTLAGAASTLAVVAPSPAAAQSLEKCEDLGVMVQHVKDGYIVRSLVAGGVAEEIGLTRGDLIFAVDGKQPASLDELHRIIFSGADNAQHDLDVLRGEAHLHTGVYHIGSRIYISGKLH